MAIPAIFSLAKRLDVSKNDNGVSKNGVYEPFSYRFSNVFVDKKIGAATVRQMLYLGIILISCTKLRPGNRLIDTTPFVLDDFNVKHISL